MATRGHQWPELRSSGFASISWLHHSIAWRGVDKCWLGISRNAILRLCVESRGCWVECCDLVVIYCHLVLQCFAHLRAVSTHPHSFDQLCMHYNHYTPWRGHEPTERHHLLFCLVSVAPKCPFSWLWWTETIWNPCQKYLIWRPKSWQDFVRLIALDWTRSTTRRQHPWIPTMLYNNMHGSGS